MGSHMRAKTRGFPSTEYFTPELDGAKFVNILMGDLQRIWVYRRKRWSIPENLQAAFRRLAELGFAKHLISQE
jgi:hypothetical protein